jgi:hypothetical protein
LHAAKARRRSVGSIILPDRDFIELRICIAFVNVTVMFREPSCGLMLGNQTDHNY